MSADFIVYSETGKLTALVGVSGYPKTNAEWAEERVASFLRTFDPPYLVLVARDKIWFWKDPARRPRPVGSIPTETHLQRFLQPMREKAETVYIGSLEAVVLSWLFEVSRDASTVPDFVRAIGFTDAIRWGDVRIAA